MDDRQAKLPLLIIVGETASGKSALAMRLAEQSGGEIICADSWTVYKGFDIGTAKPAAAELARVPHHLLDVADPADGFSAVVFQKLAREAMADIHSRGKLPILVGGTGLYIDSILYDYSFLPPSDPALRAELNQLSLTELIQRTDDLGLDTQGIDMGNKRRIIRLIENNGVRPQRGGLRRGSLLLGLQVPPDELRDRICQRVEAMINQGLEQEVRRLAAQYGWEAEPMKGIGYKEWRPYVEDDQNSAHSLDAVVDSIVKNTVDLAKRQRTWFKRNKSIHWLSTDDKLAEAVDIATTFLNK